ncbi:MAG TPA: sigma-70 family RNA polymerase sigma factor [Bacillota bacterium]|nr:sigma-70 family RNA polymerase sigma factor [Bacillota bacterium]HNU93770.1 sigma-70 family RNA polymerase sigma factor [Bacillota bacterium]HNY68543.1 sigma-70 family RNA polymerase sigma factor [Bacillota bacterium]HOI37570.1 sigma-70 family RNA polymerase sigma factor [Bacillota bacterium]
MPNETLLVERAKRNDRDALEELFRANYPVLLGALVRITGDAHVAEDVAQDAVLRAIVNLEKYEPRAKFSTWLITIALNTYRNRLRRARRELPTEDVNTAAADDAGGSAGKESAKSAEDLALGRLATSDAASLLGSLGDDKRQVFILKHYYGFTYQEIADAVGCPIGTVRSRLHDSIQILRREIARRGLT